MIQPKVGMKISFNDGEEVRTITSTCNVIGFDDRS